MRQLLVSEFRPDPSRTGPWLATLWQGPSPRGITLHGWYYLDTQPRTMLVVWEAEDDGARAAIEAAFAEGGELTTTTAQDATPGLAAAFARDLDAFGAFMRARGQSEEEVAAGLDLRRRGKESATLEEARAAGAAWAAEQAAR
jgi:hypothetical protein